MEKFYLAIDIGASSGRHIVGWLEGKEIKTREVYRFHNGVVNSQGHLVWDTERLVEDIKEGISAAFREFGALESLSIDTWGVDFVLLDGDKEILPCYAYRDSRTEAVIDAVHKKISFAELYRRTGCQFQPFNSIYQLYDDLLQGRLAQASTLLMLPEYLLYRLTGVKSREYTNATTTGMVNAETGEYDVEIIKQLGFPAGLFPGLQQPGTVLGRLLPEVAERVGGNCKVILCATHDTASAVEGIPMEENQPYISSGTWSLLGVKTQKPVTDEASRAANYSNEGGVGYNRYQKNIMGLWLVQELRKELCPDKDFGTIALEAEQSSFTETVAANDACFLSPESMKDAFDAALHNQPLRKADYFSCAYRSLAISYREALCELEKNTGKTYDKLYIVGGGAKNRFLNRLTEEATGKQVIALPLEATALGNLKIQMEVSE